MGRSPRRTQGVQDGTRRNNLDSCQQNEEEATGTGRRTDRTEVVRAGSPAASEVVRPSEAGTIELSMQYLFLFCYENNPLISLYLFS